MDIQSVHITMLGLKNPSSRKVERENSYPESVETSSVQSQNQRYPENRENQYRTYVTRKFHAQITHCMQKQAHVFKENDAIVPIEISMYVIYNDPTKSKF